MPVFPAHQTTAAARHALPPAVYIRVGRPVPKLAAYSSAWASYLKIPKRPADIPAWLPYPVAVLIHPYRHLEGAAQFGAWEHFYHEFQRPPFAPGAWSLR